jgi:hypothetical protein
VRDAVHDWALKLWQAGVQGEGMSFSTEETDRAKSVVVNIGHIGNATGIGNFGDHATITATQTLSVAELADGVRQLVGQVESVLPASGLPTDVQAGAHQALAELRAAADEAAALASRAPCGNRTFTCRRSGSDAEERPHR